MIKTARYIFIITALKFDFSAMNVYNVLTS